MVRGFVFAFCCGFAGLGAGVIKGHSGPVSQFGESWMLVVVLPWGMQSLNAVDRSDLAIVGADEVATAVAGSVLTTIVVFLPLIFVVGIMGQISKDFAVLRSFSSSLAMYIHQYCRVDSLA
jgi:hypothetical protein